MGDPLAATPKGCNRQPGGNLWQAGAIRWIELNKKRPLVHAGGASFQMTQAWRPCNDHRSFGGFEQGQFGCEQGRVARWLGGAVARFRPRGAQQAQPLHEVERTLWEQLLQIGHTAVEQFNAAQGNGDLGPQVRTANGQCLQRSTEPVDRPLRTVFGLHCIHAHVYAAAPHEKIQLRPVDARMQLPPTRCSHLFQQFSQCWETSLLTRHQWPHPHLADAIARQIVADSPSPTNRTDPSDRTKLTPPVWKLDAVHAPEGMSVWFWHEFRFGVSTCE